MPFTVHRLTRRFPRGIRTWMLAAAVALLSGHALAQQEMNREEPGRGPDPRLSPGQIAPVLEGLGDYHRRVTTDSERAQLFFDQGLKLAYAFNHAESNRAFREAARLDPECAMAYWGQALVLGPNINLPMPPENRAPAWEAIRKAVSLKDGASEPERGLIDALALRYADPATEETPEARAGMDRAYADAMGALAAKYPQDDDIATLHAASLMELNPWNYWTLDGAPRGTTAEVVATLERVIERNFEHAGAHHYYIHIIEASYNPELAEPSADKLYTLMPGAGHMVHMPSHIYMRVGRFDDAVESNRLAMLADEGYITQCRAQGIYPLAYYPHNMHFMGWAAVESGRSQIAIDAARKMAAHVPAGNDPGAIALKQTFLCTPIYTLVRFNRWDEVLAEPKPADDLTFVNAIWHYARGRAWAAKGDLASARAELEALRALAADESFKAYPIGFSTAATVLTIADRIVEAEIAEAEGDVDKAIALLEAAVRLEDGMTYNEPPDWHYPVRLSLGAALLKAGRAQEAEAVYWKDLTRHKYYPWTLYGLAQALDAQGKADQAAEVRANLKGRWAHADIDLISSDECVPKQAAVAASAPASSHHPHVMEH